MATITFTSGQSWIIPADNGTVAVRCYGGRGGNGSGDSSSSGSDGGYAEGELSVSAGEEIEVVIGGGGNGKSASAGFGTSVSAGNGGDAASVRRSPGSVGDIAILAGGGGGGAGAAYGGGDGESETTSSGSGGGNGGDSSGTGGDFASISGSDGGGSGGFDGGDGSRSTSGTNGSAAAVGGGGGGGLNGGEGGNATAAWIYSTDYLVAHGGGGAGGDGYTGGVSSSSQQNGFHSGSAKVEIDYTPTPNAPVMGIDRPNHQAGNIEINWGIIDSIVDGYYVYRTTDPNPDPIAGNRIATINNSSATSYTDTSVNRGDRYYYLVSAFESTSGNESDPTAQRQSTVGEVVYVYTDGSWTYYPIYDSELISGANFSLSSEISVFDQSSSSWREIDNE